MIVGIFIGFVVSAVGWAVFTSAKSKMDWSLPTNWGPYVSKPKVIRKVINRVTKDEKQLIYRSADEASWKDKEQTTVVPPVKKKADIKTMEYTELTPSQQADLYSALKSSDLVPVHRPSPPPLPKTKKSEGIKTLVDEKPYGSWHWNEHVDNVISSCKDIRYPLGKKGNR